MGQPPIIKLLVVCTIAILILPLAWETITDYGCISAFAWIIIALLTALSL